MPIVSIYSESKSCYSLYFSSHLSTYLAWKVDNYTGCDVRYFQLSVNRCVIQTYYNHVVVIAFFLVYWHSETCTVLYVRPIVPMHQPNPIASRVSGEILHTVLHHQVWLALLMYAFHPVVPTATNKGSPSRLLSIGWRKTGTFESWTHDIWYRQSNEDQLNVLKYHRDPSSSHRSVCSLFPFLVFVFVPTLACLRLLCAEEIKSHVSLPS